MPAQIETITLDNPEESSGFARIIKSVPVCERIKAGFVIGYIERQMPVLYAATEFEKATEIRKPQNVNIFRQEHMYYSGDFESQQHVDRLMAYFLPMTYKRISEKMGSPAERWNRSVAFARKVASLPVFRGMDPLIHCRAKSNFSIFRKTVRKNIDTDEIFDPNGIRVVVASEEDAYTVRDVLLASFSVIPAYAYKRSGKYRGTVHPSVRDDMHRDDKLFKSVRLNLANEGNLFEVQITTRKNLREYYDNPVSLGETILYHSYRDHAQDTIHLISD